MAVVDTLLEQALKLSERERGQLVARLVRSLEPHDDEELDPQDWEAAWSAEIERRMRDVREGASELVDGEAAFRAATARIASRRP